MDDELNHVPDVVGDETIPISSAEAPFERIEPPNDEPWSQPSGSSAPKTPKNLSPDDTQFSLRGMMVLLTIACCILAVGARLRLDIFAGTLGILTLITAAIMSLFDVRRAIIHLGWWILLATYVLICFAAVMRTS